MRVTRVSMRDFRGYEAAEAAFGPGLTVITGPNGAGKTNLLEALYFGCTGRSCRTTNEREVVRFGQSATRVVVSAEGEDGAHELSVGFQPGEPKRLRVDGATVEPNFALAARNIVGVDVLPVQGINVYDILRRDKLVLTKAAVDALTERFK